MTRDGERRGARVEGNALAVHHHARGQPPDVVLGVPLQALPHLEGAFRQLPDRADRAAVGAHHSTFRLQDGQVLADRHGRDAELQRQICDTRAAVLLDEAADVLLAFAREDFGSPIGTLHPAIAPRAVIGGGAGERLVAELDGTWRYTQCQGNVIEIKRNLWHAVAEDSERVGRSVPSVDGDAISSGVAAPSGADRPIAKRLPSSSAARSGGPARTEHGGST